MGRKQRMLNQAAALPAVNDASHCRNIAPFRLLERHFKRFVPCLDTIQKTIQDEGKDMQDILDLRQCHLDPCLVDQCIQLDAHHLDQYDTMSIEEYLKKKRDPPRVSEVKVIHVPGALTDICDDITQSHPESHEWWCRECNAIQSQLPRNALTSTSTPVFTFPTLPGLFIIRNPFTPQAQRTIIKACLSEYMRAPNYTSLTRHYHLPADPWALYSEWWHENRECFEKQKEAVSQNPRLKKKLKRRTVHNSNSVRPGPLDPRFTIALKQQENTTDHHQYGSPSIPASHHLRDVSIDAAIRKCRWTNLGLLYDWQNKGYTPFPKQREDAFHPDHPSQVPLMVNPPVPPLISRLVSSVVKLLEPLTGYDAERFRCEAGIVNFYGLKDTLMAHQDRSEVNSEAPLVSFSFGLSAILLMGTSNLNDTPVPIVLNSGDILVMSGPSRSAFHGVPRILHETLPSYLYPSSNVYQDYIASRDVPSAVFDKIVSIETSADPDWDMYGEYMLESRININVRQVNT